MKEAIGARKMHHSCLICSTLWFLVLQFPLNSLILLFTYYLDAGPPSLAEHLWNVFYGMGLNAQVKTCIWNLQLDHLNVWLLPIDCRLLTIYKIYQLLQEIVALSGANTLGRSSQNAVGGGKPETKYTVCIVSFIQSFYGDYINLIEPILIR